MTEDVDRTTETVAREIRGGVQDLFGVAAPGTVFSEPRTIGEDLVIAAASWERIGGFGFGAGRGSDDGGGEGIGGGGGGGGSSQGRPVAVIRVGPSGIEVKPVIDFTKIGVTVLLGVAGVWGVLRRR
jgi:uncharacterized spore protein YtfJ